MSAGTVEVLVVPRTWLERLCSLTPWRATKEVPLIVPVVEPYKSPEASFREALRVINEDHRYQMRRREGSLADVIFNAMAEDHWSKALAEKLGPLPPGAVGVKSWHDTATGELKAEYIIARDVYEPAPASQTGLVSPRATQGRP
jgi:hypothetical protein